VTARLLLALVALVAAAVPAAAAQAAPAANPPAAKLVLAGADFPDGAVVASVSPSIDPTFGITDIPSTSRFTRRFKEVHFRSLEAPQLISSAFVSKTERGAASVLADLASVARPGSSRKELMGALRAGLGSEMRGSFIRARTLRAGDAAVELVFRITSPAVSFDVAEVWVRDGRAVSAAAVVAPTRAFTLGHRIELAKLLAAHLEAA
jgi:hypothetical protein